MTLPIAPRLLRRIARDFQAREVLAHCDVCRRPCCGLETLVLELDWRRLCGLWGLRVSRREFDAALARGDGPAEIRAQDGLYYAHRRPCPAYRGGRCAVYASPLKPTGCDDFPLYEEDGGLRADLRCEALDPERIEAAMRRALPAGFRVRRHVDPDFPFLLTFLANPPR